MTIASVVQSGYIVNVYDTLGRLLTVIAAGSSPGDGLQGYTSTTVSIRQGPLINIFDENGNLLSSVLAR